MAENKTKETDADVGAFVAAVEDEQKRADSATLIAMMSKVTGCPPKLWGPSIIGFGSYHYKYASGREGDAPLLGFSPRKAEHSIYVIGSYEGEGAEKTKALLARLGKHRMGKACLYVKKLSDIDLKVLEEMMKLSISLTAEQYERTS